VDIAEMYAREASSVRRDLDHEDESQTQTPSQSQSQPQATTVRLASARL